ncbi:MAG: hypothetical protein ACE5JB_15805 [bacterium]
MPFASPEITRYPEGSGTWLHFLSRAFLSHSLNHAIQFKMIGISRTLAGLQRQSSYGQGQMIATLSGSRSMSKFLARLFRDGPAQQLTDGLPQISGFRQPYM